MKNNKEYSNTLSSQIKYSHRVAHSVNLDVVKQNLKHQFEYQSTLQSLTNELRAEALSKFMESSN
jgi:predicted deacetylase